MFKSATWFLREFSQSRFDVTLIRLLGREELMLATPLASVNMVIPGLRFNVSLKHAEIVYC